jgi:adenylate cyclase
MFDRAVALDAQYAMACAALGATYFNDWFYQWNNDPTQSLDRAFVLGQRAVASDDSLPAAHTLLSTVDLWRRQYDQAAVEAQRTIDLDPDSAGGFVANAAGGYDALATILAFAGRSQLAIPLFKKAARLDPRNLTLYLTRLGFAYRLAGRCDEALVPLQEAITLTPGNELPHLFLAGCYAELGRMKEAQAEIAEVMRLNPSYSLEWASRNVPYKDPAVRERFLAAQRKAGLK